MIVYIYIYPTLHFETFKRIEEEKLHDRKEIQKYISLFKT